MASPISKAFWAFTIGAALLAAGHQAHADRRSGKYKAPPATAVIKVKVLRSTNGKPIPDAAVIFHPIKNNKDEGAMEMKSDPDGNVKLNVIPIGDTLRLQIVADGWETYGADYKIDSDKDLVIKMNRPGAQHSAYGRSAPPVGVTPQGFSSSAKPNGQVPLPK